MDPILRIKLLALLVTIQSSDAQECQDEIKENAKYLEGELRKIEGSQQ